MMHVLFPRIPFRILRTPLGICPVHLGFQKIRFGIPMIPAWTLVMLLWILRLSRGSPRSQPASPSASQSARPAMQAGQLAGRPARRPASQPASQPTRSRPASSRPGQDPGSKNDAKVARASGRKVGARESIWSDRLAKTTRPRKKKKNAQTARPRKKKD